MISDASRAMILADLCADEGLRLTAYDDATGLPVPGGGKCEGTLTIGYGHTGADVFPGQIITEAEAETLLANDEAKAELDVLAHLPWVANLDPARQSVLVEMAFNMGIAGLLEFRNTLDAINEGRWQDASNGLLTSLAAHQEPARVARWAAKLRAG